MNPSESSSQTKTPSETVRRKTGYEALRLGIHHSIVVPQNAFFWRKMLAYLGPGFLVAVGYMDPGNWATDLAGGARFGYTKLQKV